MNTLINPISNDTVKNSGNEEKSALHRFFFSHFTLCVFIVLFLVVSSGCKQIINERNIVTTYEETFPRPEWIPDYPLVLALNHDNIAIFRRRVGGNPVWQEDDYIKEMTEGNILKLKEVGVTMVIIPFYKGFGLEAEKEHIDNSRKLTELCRKNGIKVGVYIGSTIAYETFLLKKPEAEEWFVPDYLGLPVRYHGTQVFRKRVYFMHPGFIEYMKQVVRIAIEDLKVDLIHFDNTSNRAQPPIFFHPMAIEDFRKYLSQKYTPEKLKKRLGFIDVRYVEPPKYNQPLSTIDDPLFQEWTDFRCQQLADFYGIMERYIRSLNPEVAVENNPHSGMSGNNTIWDQGVDYPRLLCHTDIFWTEEGQENESGVNDEGILNSKIRTYKMARTLNNRVFNHTSGRKIEMAEAISFNRQGMGSVGGLLVADGLGEDQKRYIKFFHNNFEYYHNIQNVADIAILHSYATMAYNNDRPYQSTFLFEQALIQEKIPFDIIFDDNLKDLSKYKVLVLADQECLSDEKLNMIRNFVNQGGGLVATEHTSLYNEWRQRKREFGLNDLFKVTAPEWHETNSPEDILDIPVQKSEVGKGRVVYIPEVQPSIPKPPAVAMTSRYWKLPVNLKELIESVQWASGNNLSIRIEAPLTVTMELTQKENKSAFMLHLLNYDSRNPSVKNIKVDVQVPEGKKVMQVSVLTPDGRTDEVIQYKETGKRIDFTVPELSVYDLVVMKLE
jgi:hypothetical protein